MHRKIILICGLFGSFQLVNGMGSPKEPLAGSNYRPESELAKDQPVYVATVTYKDGATTTIEGININGRVKIQKAHHRKGNTNIPSNINFKKVAKIEFGNKEATSLIITVHYKKGTKMEYLIDENLILGGWIEGSERASVCSIEADKLSTITFNHQIEPASSTKISQEMQDVINADINLTHRPTNNKRPLPDPGEDPDYLTDN